MARKPKETSRKPAAAGGPSAKRGTKGNRQAEAGRGTDLAAMSARVERLEKTQRELAKRIEAAIAALQKLLEI